MSIILVFFHSNKTFKMLKYTKKNIYINYNAFLLTKSCNRKTHNSKKEIHDILISIIIHHMVISIKYFITSFKQLIHLVSKF